MYTARVLAPHPGAEARLATATKSWRSGDEAAYDDIVPVLRYCG